MNDAIDMLWRQLGPFIDYLKGERRLSANTVEAYAADVKSFISFLEEEAASGDELPLTAETIRIYCRKLGSARHVKLPPKKATTKLAASSQERRLSGLKSYLKFIFKQGQLKDDLSRAVELPRKPKHLPVHLSEKEIREILDEVAGNDFNAVRNLAMLETLYATGCRVSELAGLDLEHIDLANGAAKVTGKGSKERIVILGDFALRAIRRYLIFRADQAPPLESALFINKRGRRLSVRSIQRIVKKAGISADLPVGITPHAIRHSFATHMLAGGADLRTLQELLGHSSLSTVQKYTHLDTARLKQVHSKSHPLGDG